MADVTLSIVIPDALVVRTRNAAEAAYGLDEPTGAELKAALEDDWYGRVARMVARYEGNVAETSAHAQALVDFGV